MTYRINEKDLKGQLERLYRNTNIKFSIKHYNGYYHLADNNQELSNGNSKSELYYQLVTTNKIIELMKK